MMRDDNKLFDILNKLKSIVSPDNRIQMLLPALEFAATCPEIGGISLMARKVDFSKHTNKYSKNYGYNVIGGCSHTDNAIHRNSC